MLQEGNKLNDSNINEILEFKRELVAGNVKKAMGAANAVSRDLWQVAPHEIHVIPGFNPRVNDEARAEHVRSIAQSILANGFYADKPLAGFVANEDGVPKIYLTEGHCRREGAILAIAKGAPLRTVPMVVKDRSASMEDLTVALVQSNAGKPFTPFETSVVCKRLVAFGRDEAHIAQVLGFTTTYVSKLLTLAGAPSAVRDLVQAGKVSLADAVDALRKHGENAAQVLQSAVDRASAAGKSRATATFMPEVVRNRVVARAAPQLFTAVQTLRQHEAWGRLPEDVQTLFDKALADIEQAVAKKQAKQSQPAKASADTDAPAA